MSSLVYVRYELLRTVRNRRFFILALAFPLVLYYTVAGSSRKIGDIGNTGLSAPLYFMVGYLAFGTMSAMISCGARIAAERTTGWNRQLRISPLTPRAYFRTKVLTAYFTAGLTIVVLYLAGASLGVHLPAGRWLEMTGLILFCLIPFAALGVLLGHHFSSDSIGPALGGLVAVFGIFGGAFFPISGTGFLHDVGREFPSYWLVQAAHVGIGQSWSIDGLIVVAAWTAVLTALAVRAYRRDTGRV